MYRKTLLLVNGHMRIGGGEKSLLDLLQHLDYTQYNVDLLLIEGKGDYYSQIPSNVNIVFVDTTKAYGAFWSTITKCIKQKEFFAIWFRFVILTAKLFGKKTLYLLTPILHLKSKYDCAIAYRPGPCADIVAYAVKANKKICWWHNGKCDYTPKQITEINSTWRRINNIVAVSEGSRHLIIDNFTFPEDSIVVIPNMIDIDNIQKKAHTSNPYCDKADIRFVSVCRLSPEKHLENAIYVMSQLTKMTDKLIKWYFIGDGPENRRLKSLITQNHLENHVILMGQQINPYPYIRYADYYVNTSYQESQSISVLEAMALQIPCVVTRTVGTDGYCKDGLNCFVAEQNENNLLKVIDKTIKKNIHPAIIENAQQTVYKSFLPNEIINKFDLLIQ